MGLLDQLGLQAQHKQTPGLESESQGTSTVLAFAALSSELAVSKAESALAEINTTVSGLDTLQGIQSRLEGIVSRVSNIAKDGLTQREAGMVNDSIDEINSELGAELIAMPALESFGDRISAKTYTDVGLEAADSGLAKVWKFILDTVTKIKDMFAKWWDKFFGNVETLKKYAEKVKEAKYNEDKEDKKVTIKGKALYTGDSKPTAGGIKTGIDNLEKTVDSYLVKQSQTAESVCDELTTAMEKMDGSEDKQKSAMETLVGKTSVGNYLKGAHITSNPTNGKLIAGLLGGKDVVIENAPSVGNEAESSATTHDSRDTFLKELAKVTYKVKGPSDSKGGSKETTITRLSKSDVESIAESVIDLADGILDMRKSREDARRYADDITKAAEGLKKDADRLEDVDKVNKSELTNAAKAAISVLKEVSGGSVSSWTAHLVSTSNAALKVAEASL